MAVAPIWDASSAGRGLAYCTTLLTLTFAFVSHVKWEHSVYVVYLLYFGIISYKLIINL